MTTAVNRARAWLAREDDPPTRPDEPGQRLVRLGRAHPMLADALVVMAFVAVIAPRLALHGPDPRGVTGTYILSVALLVPLIWRRRYPVAVFATLGLLGLVQLIKGDKLLADVAILVALYTVASRTPRRVAVTAAAAVEIGVLVASTQKMLGVVWTRSLAYLTAMVAAAFFFGTNIRTRRAYLAAVEERARRAEHERDQQARIAVAAERAGIAREMHDIVAHSLAVIITMADAAIAKQHSDPEQATAAMTQVSETGRQALDETRRLLGVLRTDVTSDGLAPQPGLAQLDALLDQVRATGLAATLTVSGHPFPVAVGAQLAVYRIVQEALTNTIKHASGASHVDVRVRYAEPDVEIDVVDNGAPAMTPTGRADDTGHGLIGMRERAAVYDGAVRAGPQPGGGWAVGARLRVGEPAPMVVA